MHTAWPLSWPLRWYWSHSQRKLGKKLVVDKLLKRMLPAPPAGFEAELPGGGRVFLQHQADIGLVVRLSGDFEPAETACARELAEEGTVAIDVGANVGMFTIPLALAVGNHGQVLAIEPAQDNVKMLEHNLQLNRLENVIIHRLAVAARPGQLLLLLGVDSAFHSTTAVVKGRETDGSVVVPAETLDRVWEQAGALKVSFLKIDTEGGELEILEGATQLLEHSRPAILLEAKSRERINQLDDRLTPLGYTRSRRRGFAPGNYLYTAG